jgi:hypothetical protein
MSSIRCAGILFAMVPLTACIIGDEPRIVAAGEPLPADLVTGDVVRQGLLELVVPEPGQEVILNADYEHGSSIELGVRNPHGGAVEIMQSSPAGIEPLVIAAVPPSCTNRFGVQAVGTHELGRVFGLGHVSESAHPHLTMSTAVTACSNAAVSLGLGDVRALRQLY